MLCIESLPGLQRGHRGSHSKLAILFTAEIIVGDVDLHGKSQDMFLSALSIRKSYASLKKKNSLSSFLDTVNIVINCVSFCLAARKLRAKSGTHLRQCISNSLIINVDSGFTLFSLFFSSL